MQWNIRVGSLTRNSFLASAEGGVGSGPVAFRGQQSRPEDHGTEFSEF